ncbi:type II secretion system F family protein [Candidatus Saccharibacteria bacterium]|nr:type II secretion system F family protein [Candidatus Saccharibacteria bacterium]
MLLNPNSTPKVDALNPAVSSGSAPKNAFAKPVAKVQQPKPAKKVRKLTHVSASRDAKEYFTETLSMLLSTGVPVAMSLDIIAKEITTKKVKKAILQMRDEVDEGSPLWKAVGETGILRSSSVALIKAGEESGRLAENLRVVSDQTHRINSLNAKIRSALIYPAFLIVMLVLVGSGISLFLLPKLAEIFKGLDVQLNLLTKIMIGFGIFWSHWGILITLVGFVVLFVVGLGIVYVKPVKLVAEKILFVLPGVKTIMYESEIARFGFITGSLLDAGLPIVEVLDSLHDSFATIRYQKLAEFMKQNIEEGQSFKDTFEKINDRKAFPGPIRMLITSSEKSGNLSNTLLKISTIYNEKVEIAAQNLETVIEPIILILIALGVLFVALSVILPIYGLLSGIK